MRRLSAFIFIFSSLCLFSAHPVFAASGAVNYNVAYQQIEGFGGSAVYEPWDLVNRPYREEVCDMLFRDLGLDLLRIRNTYGYPNDTGVNATGQVVAEARDRNPNIKTLLTPWSPAPYLKSNDNINGGGTLKKDDYGNYIYDQYAQWWADSIEAFAAVGVFPDFISIQNEPDIETSYDSFKINPVEDSEYAGYNEAFETVWQELNYRFGAHMPKMLGPDSTGYSSGYFEGIYRGSRDYIDNLIDEDHCYGFAFHPYSDGWGEYGYDDPDFLLSQGMADYGADYGYKPLYMTEYCRLNKTPDFADGVNLAWHIHNFLTYMRVNAYYHWTLFRGYGTGGMINIADPNSYDVHDLYWFFKAYAHFTDPGWSVLGCTAKPNENLRMTAFKNSENDLLTVVILNKSTNTEILNLAINDFEYHYSKVYRSSETEHWQYLGEFSNPVYLPAKSITTVSFTPNTMLTCSANVGGSIFIGGGESQFENYMTIVAVPLPSFHFVKWIGTAVDAGKVEDPCSADTTVFMDDNYTVTAVFARDPVAPGDIVGWGDVVTNTCLTELTAVAAGDWHSLGIKFDGSIVAWGDNSFGQSEVPAGNDFIAVAAGENHSLALKADGSVVAWGDNQFQQCEVPPPNSGFIAIAAGGNHCLGLKSNGSIVGWGSNDFGQTDTPPYSGNFVAITAGYWHSAALTEDGAVVCWGNNYYDQAAAPNDGDFVAVAAGDFHNVALKTDGTVVCWGLNDYDQSDPPDGNNFIAVAAGADHSIALTADGSVVAWGDDSSGQTNVPIGLNDVSAIAAGAYHCLVLKPDGTLTGWGNNDNGQAVPPAGNDFISVAVGGAGHILALRQDGSVVGWGYNEYGQADPPPGNDYIAVAAGGEHSLALKADGSIIAWGNNDYGQTAAPPGNDFTAIAAGYDFSVALKSDGSIIAWGCNDDGQTDVPQGNDFLAIAAGWYHALALRYDDSVAAWGWNYYQQADNPQGQDFIAIAAGWGHSLALKADGSIIGWGSNDFGETDVPAGNDFISVAAGDGFGAALSCYGSLVAWGDNYYSQAQPPEGNNFIAVAAGGSHGAALFSICRPNAPVGLSASDGNFIDHIRLEWQPVPGAEVYEIWRSVNSNMTAATKRGESDVPSFDDFDSVRNNYYYRVRVKNACGTGWFSQPDVGYICTPSAPVLSASDGLFTDHIRIDWNLVEGADSYELWRAVSGGSEPISHRGSFTAINYFDDYNVSPGLTYYYWITAQNSCGTSSFGEFESGYVDNSSQPFGITGGKIYAWGINKYGQATPPEDSDFIAVSAGYYHSLALKRDGSIVGFGCNTNGTASNPQYYGQANPPAGKNFVNISAGGFHSLALKRDGSIAAWGANAYGQATPPAGRDFVAVSAGYMHSLALRANGSIAAWGNNYYGQCNAPADTNFVAVSAGYFVSLALKADGSIVAWGGDYYDLLNTPAGRFKAISTAYYNNIALREDGSLVTWGKDASTVMAPPAGNDFTAIAGGVQQSLALKQDGRIAPWGYDSSGFYTNPYCDGFITVSSCGSHFLAITTKPVDLNVPPEPVPDIDIAVTKCSVKAAKDRTKSKDYIAVSGLMDINVDAIETAEFIELKINSQHKPAPLICRFPVNSSTFKKGKFKSSVTANGSKSTFAFSSKTQKFSFAAKSVDLSGLSCPIMLTVTIGQASISAHIDEPVVNGKKPVPMILLMGIENSLRVDYLKVKRGSKPNTDQLYVKGAFSLQDKYLNMAAHPLSVKIGTQTFSLPSGIFKQAKGKFSCSFDLYDGYDFTASAIFNFNNCTFKMLIKNTKVQAKQGEFKDCEINFGNFNEKVSDILVR